MKLYIIHKYVTDLIFQLPHSYVQHVANYLKADNLLKRNINYSFIWNTLTCVNVSSLPASFKAAYGT